MTRDSSGKPRTSLGDLTNQLGKRGFALITRSPASKSVASSPKHGDSENGSPSAKRVALSGSGAKPDKLLKGGKTYRLLSLPNSAPPNPALPIGGHSSNLGVSPAAAVSPNAAPTDAIKTLSQSSSSSETSKRRPEMPEDPIIESLGSQIGSSEAKGSGLGAADMPSTVGSGLSNLQASKPFELQRCLWLQDHTPASPDALPDADSLQACSCSFCVKAAYIWSDLHYMDVKGRISALSKSKKEASNLVKMYSVDKHMGRGGDGSSSSSSQLDMDLMNRCKSLFVFMEDFLAREHNQLETKISSLKRMREDFKMNLGTVTEMPPDAQHFASTDDPSGTKMP